MTDKMLIDRSVVEQALEALKAAVSDDQPYIVKSKEAVATLRAALDQPQAEQEPVADRENAIIRFALHQLMSNAYSHMNAAAQDKDGLRYQADAVEKFAKDAKDAEALLNRLKFTAPHPQPKREPLTDEQIDALCIEGRQHWLGKRKIARAIERAHGIVGE